MSVVVTMMVVAATANCLRQILNVGELAALRSAGEVRGKLGELARRGSVAFRRGGLGGALQVGGDLLRYLLVFRRVRLLKLLQRAH